MQRAWDGNAVTVAELAYDGEYSFRIGQCTGIVVGLSSIPSLGSPAVCTHGFFFEGGRFSLIERGVRYTPIGGALWSGSDVFTIRRIDGVVTYHRNGVDVRTSATPSRGLVALDAALYSAGDEVLDVTFAALPGVGTAQGALAPFSAQAFEGGGVALGTWRIAVTLADVSTATLTATLTPWSARASDSTAHSFTQLPAFTGWGHDLPIPTFDAAFGAWSITAYGTSEAPSVGTANAALTPWVGLAADRTDVGRAVLAPFTARMQEVITAEALFLGVLGGLRGGIDPVTGASRWSVLKASLPGPTLSMSGALDGIGWLRATVPAPTFRAHGGGTLQATLPAPSLRMTSTLPAVGRMRLTLPAPVLRMGAIGGEIGAIRATLPAPTFSAFGGGAIRATLPAPALRIAATLPALATIRLTIPAPTFRAKGQLEARGVIRASIPAPTFFAGRGNSIRLSLPAPQFTARGGPAPDPNATLTYVVNTMTGAVTRWGVGAFVKLITVDGVLHGLRADGTLWRFTGDTDNGQPIETFVRFAPQRFDTNHAKRFGPIYFFIEEATGLTMEVIADETTLWRYQTATDNAPAAGTHKIKPGRGIVFHTAGITLRNRAGGEFAIGGIEPVVYLLSRKPR